MLKRSIAITTPCKLNIRNSQLIITSSTGDINSVPVEDLAHIIIENQRAQITIPALNCLAENNVCVTLCDKKALPSSIITPLNGNSLQGERHRIQLNASIPAKKAAWKQIIESKIRNQALLLQKIGKDSLILKPYYQNVKSGDSDNREGVAAAIYWKQLLGKQFVRDPKGEFPNDLLNYGYTILRAATARAIIASGLLPSVGIHHKNRYNHMPLADDIMEPFRPWVDMTVIELIDNGTTSLDRHAKNQLIQVIYSDTEVNNHNHPLSISLSMLCTSILSMMDGKTSTLSLPKLI